MKNPLRRFKAIFEIDDDPESIAKGFSLGSFVGMMPIPGLQMLVVITLATFVKVNKRAACCGVFITNVVTGVFIFGFNYWLGKKVLHISSSFELPKEINFNIISVIIKAGYKVFFSLVVGGIITGTVSGFISYFLIKKLIENHR